MSHFLTRFLLVFLLSLPPLVIHAHCLCGQTHKDTEKLPENIVAKNHKGYKSIEHLNTYTFGDLKLLLNTKYQTDIKTLKNLWTLLKLAENLIKVTKIPCISHLVAITAQQRFADLEMKMDKGTFENAMSKCEAVLITLQKESLN